MILYINCFYWASSANDAYTTQNTSEKFIAILRSWWRMGSRP